MNWSSTESRTCNPKHKSYTECLKQKKWMFGKAKLYCSPDFSTKDMSRDNLKSSHYLSWSRVVCKMSPSHCVVPHSLEMFGCITSLALAAPIHCRGSISEQVMSCKIKKNINIRTTHGVNTFSANSHSWVIYSDNVSAWSEMGLTCLHYNFPDAARTLF